MNEKAWLCAGLLLMSGCASAKASLDVVTPTETVLSPARYQKEYLLVPGDQVDVVVQRSPEVSRNVSLRPDGYISLSLLGDVAAAGLTVTELSAKLTQLFSVRLINPEVTVIATQVRQPAVYVVGDVGAPGPVSFRDAPTAMQAITRAGGLRRSAAAGDIAIIRLGEDGRLRAIRIPVQVKGQPGPFMALTMASMQPDDVVFVPESGRSQMARFLDDFVARPFTSLAAISGTWVNFRYAQQTFRTP